MRSRCLVLLSAVWLATFPQAKAGEPSASDLIKLAPLIQTSDPKLKSVELVGSMKDTNGGNLRFRALYRAPNKYAILISDGSDGTPLIVAAEHQVLYYDPVRPSVTCLKDCSSSLTFDRQGNVANYLLNIAKLANPADKTRTSDLIKIDVKSLCEMSGLERRVVKTGESQYRLFLGREGWATAVCSFDTRKTNPLVSMRAFVKGSHEPVFAIDKIVIDGPIADEEFRFPDRKRLAEKLSVRNSAAGGALSAEGEIDMIMKSCRVRLEVSHPGLRDQHRLQDSRRLDWDKIRDHDRKYAVNLRKLLPSYKLAMPPELPKPAGSPVMPVAGINDKPAS